MTCDQIHTQLRCCLPRFSGDWPLDTPVQELALDSMDTVELLCVIHAEFGVRLTEAEFHPHQTLRGLLAVIESRLS